MKSKFFRVAVSGSTVDGRVINPQWLKDAAELYDSELYAARIWPEHIRGASPGGDFKAQGDVIALEAREETINGKKRTALYAQIKPLPSLIEMNKKGEKLYTSIEVLEDFDESGRFYLGGLAVTDSPASLGTQRLSFAAKHFNAHITDALETVIEFEEDVGSSHPSAFSRFATSIMDKVNMFKKSNDAQVVQLAALVESMASTFADELKAQTQRAESLAAEQEQYKKTLNALEDKYSVLDVTDAKPQNQRPAATGSGNFTLTDC